MEMKSAIQHGEMPMKRWMLSLMLIVAVAATAQSAKQEAKDKEVPSMDRPVETNLVFDDDGGKAQIVPADLSAVGTRQFHGGAVMKEVQQVSVFLGGAWGDQQVRTRQAALLNLNASQPGTKFADGQKHSVKVLSAAPSVDDFSDLSKSQVGDLTIQSKLAEMIEHGVLPQPAANSVYVVFLAPGINSTIGAHKAGVDYAAYHNFFHVEAGAVRYVVVPFQEGAVQHVTAASRALAETALNPGGDGWY